MTTPNDGTRAWRSCYSKRKYGSESLAEQVAAAWTRKKPSRPLFTYHCNLCSCWHLTSQRRNRRAAG